ncbi:MAG: hypothetical protein AAFR07_16135 [Pseudomonadota bacterium]
MSKRIRRLSGELGAFVKQYGRKAQRGVEPNDRRYDRDVEQLIKQIDPVQLSDLIAGDEHLDPETESDWYSGREVVGIKFRFEQVVFLESDQKPKDRATVVSLLGISPKPRYLINLIDGREIDVLESQLRAI